MSAFLERIVELITASSEKTNDRLDKLESKINAIQTNQEVQFESINMIQTLIEELTHDLEYHWLENEGQDLVLPKSSLPKTIPTFHNDKDFVAQCLTKKVDAGTLKKEDLN